MENAAPIAEKSVRQMLDSEDFRGLVRRRWTVSLVLTVVLFVVYYGYILLIAADKEFLAQKIGEVTTLGIPVGVAVIVIAWALTAIYVVWANRSYDPDVARLKDALER